MVRDARWAGKGKWAAPLTAFLTTFLTVAAVCALVSVVAGCDRAASERIEVLRWSAEGRLGGLTVMERPAIAPPPDAVRSLTIAATGDLKGWISTRTLYPDRGRSTGLAHVWPRIEALREADPELVLLDAGDALHGAPSATLAVEGSGLPALEFPIVDLMNALRYDAMALGNFDFALGRASLAHAEAHSDFRWLSANAERREGGTWWPPYTVLERGEGPRRVRIGVLGLTTPAAAVGRHPRDLHGLRFGDLVAAARRWVPILRNREHVDVLVGLFHSGLEGDYARDVSLRSGIPLIAAAGAVAEQVQGLDLIVSADAHQLSPRVATDPGSPWPVPVLQPGAYGNGVVVADLSLKERHGRWRVVDVRRRMVPALPDANPTALGRVAGVMDYTQARLQETTVVRFRRVPYRTEFHRCAGALSHATALFLDRTQAPGSLSLLPMRWDDHRPRKADLGTYLRRAHLYRWLRYGDGLVQVRLTGRQIERLLAGYVRHERGWRVAPLEVLWPGGLSVALAERGSGLASLRTAETGVPIEPHALYSVWMTAFHARGGLGLAWEVLIGDAAPLQEIGTTLRAGLFALLNDRTFILPAECRRWLEH